MLDRVKINDPKELFSHNLGSALEMENTVLDMLGDLQDESKSPELKQQLSHHADETRQQIRNLEQTFAAIGENPDTNPCLPIDGIQKEGKAKIKMTDDALVDAVILEGAAETEHHEIAVYEELITHAQSMGNQEAVRLLSENLEQEQHTLQEVKDASRRMAERMPMQSA